MNHISQSASVSAVKHFHFQERGSTLEISDGVGKAVAVSLRWLRLDCRCVLCGESWSGKKWQTATDIPADLSIQSMEKDEEGLGIVWSDDHVSHYGWDQLSVAFEEAPDRGLAGDGLQSLRLNKWDGRMNRDLKIYDAKTLKENPANRYEALEELMRSGIIKVSDVGLEMDDTRSVARLFGPIRTNSYGEIQDLMSKPVARVAGDTSNAQIPHTDEPFRYAPPGFIFFHAIQVGEGDDGTSIMTDGFHIADLLKAQNPGAYDLLANKRLVFHREHSGSVFYESEARAICLDSNGEVTGIRFNDRCFGPQRGNASEQDRIIAAFEAFSRLVQDPNNQLHYKIKPGEMLVFDNHRIMHGRMAFDPTKAVRHLRSCNVDRDEVHSAYRTLARKFRPDLAPLRLYQGSVV